MRGGADGLALVTLNNLLAGVGIAVGLIVLSFALFQALDSDSPSPEASATSTTVGSEVVETTLEPTSSTSTSTTSTTISAATTTTASGSSGGSSNAGGGISGTTATLPALLTNQPPVANTQDVAALEDGPGVAIALTGSDPQGTALTFQTGSSPTNGVLSGTAPNLTYTPNPNAFGVDSFSFTVTSDGQTSAAATVSITIAAAEDNPVAVDDSATTLEDAVLILPASGAGSPAANDTDADGDTLSVVAVSGSAGGTVGLAGGQITFDPDPSVCGADAGGFDYSVSDGAEPDVGHVTLAITCVNAAPEADDETGHHRRGRDDR